MLLLVSMTLVFFHITLKSPPEFHESFLKSLFLFHIYHLKSLVWPPLEFILVMFSRKSRFVGRIKCGGIYFCLFVCLFAVCFNQPFEKKEKTGKLSDIEALLHV